MSDSDLVLFNMQIVFIIIIFLFAINLTLGKTVDFHRSPSDSKSPQISKTLPSIVDDFSSDVGRKIASLPWISCFLNSFSMAVSSDHLLLPHSYSITVLTVLQVCPVGWGCRIYRQHLCRGVRLP